MPNSGSAPTRHKKVPVGPSRTRPNLPHSRPGLAPGSRDNNPFPMVNESVLAFQPMAPCYAIGSILKKDLREEYREPLSDAASAG